jgi:mono/diheme cytochrome c family protein
MFTDRKTTLKFALIGIVAALALLFATSVAAEEETIGSDEYRVSCLSCHGVGGRGDGPLAQYLTVKPTDLTTLAQNNGGQYPNLKAGAYPFLRVYQVIDGRADVALHGDRAMPVWGSRYLMEQPMVVQEGPYAGAYEKVVRGRILELVYYIQSIQQ